MDRRDLVRGIAIFADLSAAEAEKVAGMMEEVSVGRGRVVISRGEPGGRLYLIVSGSVRVVRSGASGREVAVAVLGEGNFFGEMSLLDGQPRSADVIAVRASRFLVLDRERFLRRILPLPGIAGKVLTELSKRIRAADQTIENLALASVGDRLLHLLGHIGRRYPLRGGVAEITRGPTHQEMADLVGASREAVTRTLAALAAEGLIQVNRRRIVLLPAFFRREEGR